MEMIGFLIMIAVLYLVISNSRRDNVKDDGSYFREEEPHGHNRNTYNSQPSAASAPKQPRLARKGIHCKRCKSLDVELISDNSKKVKGGGLLMGCLAWPLAFLGVNGKKATSFTYRCTQCGNVFRYDLKRKMRH